MEHSVYRVVSFVRTGPYTLSVGFDDGLVRTIDFEPVLVGEIYGPLADEKILIR